MSTIMLPGELGRARLGASTGTRLRLKDLESPEQFNASLFRERARSDRSGEEFALVLIRPQAGRRNSKTKLRAVRTVLPRLRDTDRAGWYTDRVLGIILPDTSITGARKVVAELQSRLTKADLAARFHVFAYPTDWAEVDRRGSAAKENESFEPQNLLPDLLNDLGANQVVSERPMEELLAQPLPWWKRAMDVMGAGAGIIALSPVMIGAAVAVKLTSPGPVFFVQRRAGLGGRIFPILKFRTMCTDAEALKQALRKHSEQDGPAFKMVNDPRITKIGKLLRKTSIDELPQLFNVLKGDMTLVGPRPLPCPESNACARWQKRRLDVTPGLTCIWQVKGRSKVTFAEWIRMDIAYIRSRSVTQDVKLILQTVPAVLLQRGAR